MLIESATVIAHRAKYAATVTKHVNIPPNRASNPLRRLSEYEKPSSRKCRRARSFGDFAYCFRRRRDQGSGVFKLKRPSDNVQSALHQARNSLGDPEESLSQVASNMMPSQSADHGTTQSNLHATSGSIDDSSIDPELLESDGGIPWPLPIEPHVSWCVPLVASLERMVLQTASR